MCEGDDEQREMIEKFNAIAAASRHQDTARLVAISQILAQEKRGSIDDCCVHDDKATEDGSFTVEMRDCYDPNRRDEPLKYATRSEASDRGLYVVPNVTGISYATKKGFEDSYRIVNEPDIGHGHFHALSSPYSVN